MYSPEARARRICLGTRRDGAPCRSFACWDDPLQRCSSHAGRHHTGPIPPAPVYASVWDVPEPTYTRSRAPVCRCPAYAWPHRLGGGYCQWPDAPTASSPTPAGTHAEGRIRRRRRGSSRSSGTGAAATRKRPTLSTR
jgi:hypothetical protein